VIDKATPRRESRTRLLHASLDTTQDLFLYVRLTGEIQAINRRGRELLHGLFTREGREAVISEAPLPFAAVLFRLVLDLREAPGLPFDTSQGVVTLFDRPHRYYAAPYVERFQTCGFVLRLVPEIPRTAVPGEESGGFPLTRREREIVTLLARGRHTAEICALLAISRETFKTHLKHVYEKTGAVSRVDLMVRVGKGRAS
jgi:DNA-binding CsgD family transcriptional regulator